MASKVIVEKSAQTTKSRLIKAMEMALSTEAPKIPENGQFGFKVSVQTPSIIVKNSEFDIEFEIPFDDDMVANEAEITIYNLSDSSLNRFKVNDSLSVKAGYNSDTGVIFEGFISKVKTVREGVDRVTTIYALDDVKYASKTMEEKTYSKGASAKQILEDLINSLGLTVAVFEPKRDYNFENETKVDGNVVENIKKYSEICGVSTYVYKQKVYCRSLLEGDNLHFNVNSNTGMIDSPEPFEEESTNETYVDVVKGYKVSMILQHRISTAGIVKLDSNNCRGEYRISGGTHSCDGLSAITEFKCIDTISTTVEEKTTTSSASEETDEYGYKKDWTLINSRRNLVVKKAVEMANNETFGYAQGNSGNGQFKSYDFVVHLWTQVGVEKLRQHTVTEYGQVASAFQNSGFEEVKRYKMWQSTPSGVGLEKGDVLFMPLQMDFYHYGWDEDFAIYLGDGRVVMCSLRFVQDLNEAAADGDQSGYEIRVYDYKEICPAEDEQIDDFTCTVLRYMGNELNYMVEA